MLSLLTGARIEELRALTRAAVDLEGDVGEHRSALVARTVVEQAPDIITGQNRCAADEAFEVLRSLSQNRHVGLCDIAPEMISAVGGRPPASSPTSHDRSLDGRRCAAVGLGVA